MTNAKRTLRSALRQFVLSLGLWVDRTTKDEELRAFLARTRPYRSRQPLARYGPKADGGYIVPDDLDGIRTMISPGISSEVGFDLAMAERGMDIVMADASVTGPPIRHPRFHFHKRHLSVVTADSTIKLDDLVALAPNDDGGDMILQMDIEGAEYPILLDTSDETLARFRVILIEFHDLPSLFSKTTFPLLDATFRKVLRHHYVAHIHPNNCCGSLKLRGFDIPFCMEFTFHRRDRDFTGEPATGPFPHPLDQSNVADKPLLPLPACWYRRC